MIKDLTKDVTPLPNITLYAWVRENIIIILQKIGKIKEGKTISHEESKMIDKLTEASFWAKLCEDNLKRDEHVPTVSAKVTIKETPSETQKT